MGLYELIVSRRTVRRFKPVPIGRPVLERIVNAGRLAPSAGNLQPLEFVVVDDPGVRAEVFRCLRWASYIAPQGNPRSGEEPMAYILPVANRLVRDHGYDYDLGAAMENMILAACEAGIGSCWLISVDKETAREILNLPEKYELDCVLALGYPAESPVTEEFSGSVKYWKDEAGVLHVPKRQLNGIIHFNRFVEGGR